VEHTKGALWVECDLPEDSDAEFDLGNARRWPLFEAADDAALNLENLLRHYTPEIQSRGRGRPCPILSSPKVSPPRPEERALLFAGAFTTCYQNGNFGDITSPVSLEQELVLKVSELYTFYDRCQRDDIPCAVELVYHWTKSHSVDGISKKGLRTADDLRNDLTEDQYALTGAVYGSGVYTSSNPYTFNYFGDHLILCLGIRGKADRVKISGGTPDPTLNCVIGNKTKFALTKSESDPYDEIIYKTSQQVFPALFLGDNTTNTPWRD
jgi:hypothetical protein